MYELLINIDMVLRQMGAEARDATLAAPPHDVLGTPGDVCQARSDQGQQAAAEHPFANRTLALFRHHAVPSCTIPETTA
jgi:hypothetical protein